MINVGTLRQQVGQYPALEKVLRFVYLLPKFVIGGLICRLSLPPVVRYKEHLLSSWMDSNKRSVIDSLLYPSVYRYWIELEYLRESHPDKREMLKSLMMGGTSGKNWAESYHNTPLDLSSQSGHMSFAEANPVFSEIDAICEIARPDLVVQLGSSSGREIAYFAAKYPDIECIGTDIYDEVIRYSSKLYDIPNLSFEISSAQNMGQFLSPHSGKDILLYSSGSIQYVQPEHLPVFFNALTNYANLKVLISEAANESQGLPDELKRSIWRGNFSYTHDYKYYAESSGIRTLKCKIVRPYFPYEDFPMHKNTVHYFYYGET